jgi:hypothetical protein
MLREQSWTCQSIQDESARRCRRNYVVFISTRYILPNLLNRVIFQDECAMNDSLKRVE